MKTLIIYYSRTGTTKKVAEILAQKTGAHTEQIIDIKNRDGPIGYIKAGKDATLKKLAKIQELKRNPQNYDIIIIGTPVWAWNITPAIRTYLHKNKEMLKDKRISFFCTMGGSGDKQSFAEMHKIIGKSPKATLTLLTKEVWNNNYETKLKEFIKKT